MKKAKKLGTCAGCGQEANTLDGTYRVGVGQRDGATLVRRVYHVRCVGYAPVGVAYRYTEAPGRDTPTACLSCGHYYYERQDWDMVAYTITGRDVIAQGGATCDHCTADLYQVAYQSKVAADKHAAKMAAATREEAAR